MVLVVQIMSVFTITYIIVIDNGIGCTNNECIYNYIYYSY